MDACDELGLFVIVATPGWQYWNKDLQFGELVHRNTREMIRRDRNHPSVLMWEPILNETRYPLDFALKALEITKEEYDRWRYRYPELDTSGQWHKITPSQELSDLLLADLKEHSEE